MEMIAAFGLFLTRTSALVLSAPLLGFGTGFSGYKVAMIFLLSFVLYVASGQPIAADVDQFVYGAMMLREALIGIFLGFLLHLVLLAVRVGGEMISHEMGFMVATQVDPTSGVRSSLITSFYENLFLLALLLLNGHHWLIRSLASSFEQAPIGMLALGEGVAPTVQTMFGEMFGAGVVFAAPVTPPMEVSPSRSRSSTCSPALPASVGSSLMMASAARCRRSRSSVRLNFFSGAGGSAPRPKPSAPARSSGVRIR